MTDGTLTPVVDFSTVTEAEYGAQSDPTVVPMRVYSPWTASMTPNNDMLLMWQSLADATGFFVSSLPPTDALPSLDYKSQINSVVTPRSSRASDGKVLIGDVVYQLAQP